MTSSSRWTWAAASRRGLAHERASEPRQDAQRVRTETEGSWIIAIACDGAGSASHGGAGAVLCTRILSSCAVAHIRYVGDKPNEMQIAAWFGIVRQVIATAAGQRGLAMSDFATTAVVAISDGVATTTAHVGDGAVVARLMSKGDEEVNRWTALSWPEHGEYVSTTFFVTDEYLRLRVSQHSQPVDRIVAMTDGLERLALDFAAGAPHAPFLEGLCHPLLGLIEGRNAKLSASLARYLSSDAVNRRTDDDKTLILAALL